jgi:hypothetical protein
VFEHGGPGDQLDPDFLTGDSTALKGRLVAVVHAQSGLARLLSPVDIDDACLDLLREEGRGCARREPCHAGVRGPGGDPSGLDAGLENRIETMKGSHTFNFYPTHKNSGGLALGLTAYDGVRRSSRAISYPASHFSDHGFE